MLSRRKRTEVLVEADAGLAVELAELIENETEVVQVTPPHQGLVMCQARETARGTRFYLSEALMTECRVRIGEEEGLGMVLGSNERLARALAVIDAAYAQSLPLRCLAAVDDRIWSASERLDAARKARDARTDVSRVEFNEMSGQDMSVQAVVK